MHSKNGAANKAQQKRHSKIGANKADQKEQEKQSETMQLQTRQGNALAEPRTCVEEEAAHGDDSTQQREVDQILAGQGEGSAVQDALQLAKRHGLRGQQ